MSILTAIYGWRKPAGSDAADPVAFVGNLGDDIEATVNSIDGRLKVVERRGIVASWALTPSLLGVTTETDVLNVSWTPPAVANYQFRVKMPCDCSSGVADAKGQLYVAGNLVDFDQRQCLDGVLVAYLRMTETWDITSTAAITLRATIQRAGSNVGTLNCRVSEARLEVYNMGATGVRA